LLIYAAALGENVDGVFFGQLKPRELCAVGYSREKYFESTVATVKRDWDEFMQQSEQNIERIARAFLEGDAAVNPIKGACDFCGLQPFCRVREQDGGEEDADDQ
jgi:ATP-dependent helicase/DNAse subunit B